MRIKGKIRIDTPTVRVDINNGVFIKDYILLGSRDKKITNELLHAITVDYAFWRLAQIDQIYTVHDIVARRKATRRIIHDVDTMHNIIDQQYNCPLLLRGKPYAWNEEVYNFNQQKFIK